MAETKSGNSFYQLPQGDARNTPTFSLVGSLLFFGALIPTVLAYFLTMDNELRVLMAAIGLMTLLVVFASPFLGLVLFVALLYIRPEDTIPSLTGLQMPLIVSVVTLTGLWFRHHLKKEKFVQAPVNLMIIGFLCAAVISTISGGNPLTAFTDVGKLAALYFLILNLVNTRKRFGYFVTLIILLSCYLAGYAIYHYLKGDALDANGLFRAVSAGGLFGDPNDFAAVTVGGLALALGRVSESISWKKLSYLALSGIMIWGIMLSSSRGGLLAMMVVFAGLALRYMRKNALLIPLIALAAFFLVAHGSSHMTDFSSQERSANDRLWFWDDGITQFLHNPLTGSGYGQFTLHNGGRAAHNSFVICFAETGFIGYFFWMGLIYYAYKRKRETGVEMDKQGRGDLYFACLALTGYLAAVFFLSHTYYPNMFIFMSLPVVQQITYYGKTDIMRVEGKEGFRDVCLIAAICALSIIGIKLMVLRLA